MSESPSSLEQQQKESESRGASFPSILSCTSCKGKLVCPRTLPCLHSFCHQCLPQGILKGSDESSCRFCGETFPFPQDDDDSSFTNSFIVDSLEASERLAAKNLLCESCEADPADIFCTNCAQYFCSGCHRPHKKSRVSLGHKYTRVDDMAALKISERVIYCPQHPDEEIKLYCKDCLEVTCQKCAVVAHQGHGLDLIENVSQAAGQSIAESLKQASAKKGQVETFVEGIHQLVNDLEQSKNEREKDIRQAFAQVRLQLDLRERNLLENLAALEAAKRGDLLLQEKRLLLSLEGIQATVGFAEALQRDGSPVDLIQHQPSILGRLRSVEKHDLPTGLGQKGASDIIFFAETEPLLRGVSEFGQVESNETSELSVISRDPAVCFPISKPYSFTILAVNRWGEKLNFGGSHFRVKAVSDDENLATTIDDLCNGSYVVRLLGERPGDLQISVFINESEIKGSPFALRLVSRDYTSISEPSQRLWMNDLLGPSRKLTPEGDSATPPSPHTPRTPTWLRGFCIGPHSTLVVTDSVSHGFYCIRGKTLAFHCQKKGDSRGTFSSPKAVCCSPDGFIFIADTHNHRVQVFDLDGTFRTAFGSKGTKPGLFNSPSGITMGRRRHLVVADTGNHRIQVIQGNEISAVFGERGDAPGKLEKPVGVAVNSLGEIVVADSGNHRIQVFDEAGNFLRAFGGPGSRTGRFDCPSQVAVDRYDNILVCDTNNRRVQVFDPNGKHLHSIDTQPHLPFGVDVDENGRVFVAESSLKGSFIVEY